MAKKKKTTKNKNSLQKLTNSTFFKKYGKKLTIVVFAVVGVALLGLSFAADNTAGTCGARVQNYTYQVPFGKAAWNVPVCNLAKHPQSADYVNRLYNYGRNNDGSPSAMAQRGNITVGFGMGDLKSTFSRAVYDVEDATTKIKVQVCGTPNCNPSNLDGAKVPAPAFGQVDKRYLPDAEVPWNPDWPVAQAGDNEVVIRDSKSGKLWSFAQVKKIYPSGDPRNLTEGAIGQCGIIKSDRTLCVVSAKILRDYNGAVADYRTYEGSTGDRGGGISYYSTLLTPEEVEAGEIRHALGVGLFNTAYGPECTKDQLAKNDPNVVGKSCGTAMAPAGKFEWGDSIKASERAATDPKFDDILTLNKTIPEGMRFALKPEVFTDTYIKNWVDARYTGQKARTAKIIVTALRDYGFIAVDTGGVTSIQTAGGVSPKNREKWNGLGISSTDDHSMLHGLFNESSFYVVEPPVNQCIDGTKSKFYCKYNTSKYEATNADVPVSGAGGGTSTPVANAAPTVSLAAINGTYVAPSTVTLTASASDTDGKVSKVEFYSGATRLGEDTTSPYSYTWSNVPAGTYSITAKATDDQAKTTVTTARSVTVQKPPTNNNAGTIPTPVSIPAEFTAQVRWNSKLFEFHQSTVVSWGESVSSKPIAKYVLVKNGTPIYEGTNRSFTDFGVNDGQRYKYEITAVNTDGRTSVPTVYERVFRCTWFGLSCSFQKQ